jgi:hypothetical protein
MQKSGQPHEFGESSTRTLQGILPACLPTMKAQTTQQFLWIIRTDPNLDKSIINEMVDLLKDHPNFYLVGLNTQGDTFEQGCVGEIYTGNRTLFLTTKDAQKHLPVIETRLETRTMVCTRTFSETYKVAPRRVSREANSNG